MANDHSVVRLPAELIPAAVKALLSALQLDSQSVRHFVFAAPTAAALQVAKAAGLPAESVTDARLDRCGHTGTAHPLKALFCLEQGAADEVKLLIPPKFVEGDT